MASDYISREWLMQTLGITSFDCEHCEWAEHFTYRCKRGGDFEDACCAIEDAPSADVRENVRARWTYDENNNFVCSNCGNSVSFTAIDGGWTLGRFCQTCGADMRGENYEK